MRTIKQIKAQRAKALKVAKANNIKRDKLRPDSLYSGVWTKPVKQPKVQRAPLPVVAGLVGVLAGIPVTVGNPSDKESTHNVQGHAGIHV